MRMGRLIILTGPSCAGKSPLKRCVARLHPEIYHRLSHVVLYNSRTPRPGEVDGKDYHFRERAEIEGCRGRQGFIVMDVRGDLQALDVNGLLPQLEAGDVLYEGNPVVAHEMLTNETLKEMPSVGIYLSPLSGEEMRFVHQTEGVDPRRFVTDVSRRKLLRRTRRQKGELSLKDLEEVERRAGAAYDELKLAVHFEHVLVNHDGEDSDNWNAFYFPVGEARRALLDFVAILVGDGEGCGEQWRTGDWS
ncbi:MAG: hypothetical protein GF418_06710 [Chitinivibrionales bacterium]|nr:hypothetical protein [Chitinivibrionales bacterium]MBD3395302.1 hypothetical protein [Chitinivibrionales bacterium]